MLTAIQGAARTGAREPDLAVDDGGEVHQPEAGADGVELVQLDVPALIHGDP